MSNKKNKSELDVELRILFFRVLPVIAVLALLAGLANHYHW